MAHRNIKSGFSLVEVMIIFTIIAVIMAAAMPVITKRTAAPTRRAIHGSYTCIAIGENQIYETMFDGRGRAVEGYPRITGQQANAPSCTFNVTSDMASLNVQLYGAGSGGRKYADYTTVANSNYNVAYLLTPQAAIQYSKDVQSQNTSNPTGKRYAVDNDGNWIQDEKNSRFEVDKDGYYTQGKNKKKATGSKLDILDYLQRNNGSKDMTKASYVPTNNDFIRLLNHLERGLLNGTSEAGRGGDVTVQFHSLKNNAFCVKDNDKKQITGIYNNDYDIADSVGGDSRGYVTAQLNKYCKIKYGNDYEYKLEMTTPIYQLGGNEAHMMYVHAFMLLNYTNQIENFYKNKFPNDDFPFLTYMGNIFNNSGQQYSFRNLRCEPNERDDAESGIDTSTCQKGYGYYINTNNNVSTDRPNGVHEDGYRPRPKGPDGFDLNQKASEEGSNAGKFINKILMSRDENDEPNGDGLYPAFLPAVYIPHQDLNSDNDTKALKQRTDNIITNIIAKRQAPGKGASISINTNSTDTDTPDAITDDSILFLKNYAYSYVRGSDSNAANGGPEQADNGEQGQYGEYLRTHDNLDNAHATTASGNSANLLHPFRIVMRNKGDDLYGEQEYPTYTYNNALNLDGSTVSGGVTIPAYKNVTARHMSIEAYFQSNLSGKIYRLGQHGNPGKRSSQTFFNLSEGTTCSITLPQGGQVWDSTVEGIPYLNTNDEHNGEPADAKPEPPITARFQCVQNGEQVAALEARSGEYNENLTTKSYTYQDPNNISGAGTDNYYRDVNLINRFYKLIYADTMEYKAIANNVINYLKRMVGDKDALHGYLKQIGKPGSSVNLAVRCLAPKGNVFMQAFHYATANDYDYASGNVMKTGNDSSGSLRTIRNLNKTTNASGNEVDSHDGRQKYNNTSYDCYQGDDGKNNTGAVYHIGIPAPTGTNIHTDDNLLYEIKPQGIRFGDNWNNDPEPNADRSFNGGGGAIIITW